MKQDEKKFEETENNNSNKNSMDTSCSMDNEQDTPRVDSLPQMGVELMDVVENAEPTIISINSVPEICITTDDFSDKSTIPSAGGWVTVPIIRGHSDSGPLSHSAVSIHELSDSEAFVEECTKIPIIQEYEERQEGKVKKHSVPSKPAVEFEDVTNCQPTSNSEETMERTEHSEKVPPAVSEKTDPSSKGEMPQVHIAFSRNIENEFEETNIFDEKFLKDEKAKLIPYELGLLTIEATEEVVLEYECIVKGKKNVFYF